jgi:hypothetical protein
MRGDVGIIYSGGEVKKEFEPREESLSRVGDARI